MLWQPLLVAGLWLMARPAAAAADDVREPDLRIINGVDATTCPYQARLQITVGSSQAVMTDPSEYVQVEGVVGPPLSFWGEGLLAGHQCLAAAPRFAGVL
jgi:hypothetical protein